MKNTIILILFSLSFSLIGQDISIQDINFKVEKFSLYSKTFDKVPTTIYNVAFSSVLPERGIYKMVSSSTKHEAIIRVGYSQISTPSDVVYVTDDLYDFFASHDSVAPTIVTAKLTFLGWSEEGDKEAGNDFLNLQSLVIKPDDVAKKAAENDDDTMYIQLGSFSFYQNSYPRITQLLPYLELRPEFYMVEEDVGGKKVFRVMAGPYAKKDAIKITKIINATQKDAVYLQGKEALMDKGKR